MEAVGYLTLGSAALGLVLALAAPARAQLTSPASDPWAGRSAAGPDRIGLHPSSAQLTIGCGTSLLPCGSEAATLQARERSAFQWNLELSQLHLGASDRLVPGAARDGLNLSLVGRKPLFGSRFSVYGKVGTTYGYAEEGAALTAGQDGAHGLSFGAGLSMAVTPSLSATLGWDSHDLRLGSGGRESVRALGLGLQYRY